MQSTLTLLLANHIDTCGWCHLGLKGVSALMLVLAYHMETHGGRGWCLS